MSETGSARRWPRWRGVRWLKASPTVLEAEVQLLEHTLASYGPLTRETLAERCGAGLWHEGTFEAALRAGEERGVLRLRPGGFVELSPRSRFALGGWRRRASAPPASSDGT